MQTGLGGEDLAVLGKAVQRLLGEDQVPVQRDLEDAPARGDELTVGSELPLDGVRQTGGARLVVSNDAVFDLHGGHM